MSIKVVNASTGERMVLLTDGRLGLPDVWVAGYSISELRSLRPRSIRNTIESIEKGLAFYRKQGVGDLVSRLKRKLPGNDELQALAEHLRKRSFREGAPAPANAKDPILRASTHYAHFVDYLCWLHEQLNEDANATEMALLRMDFRLRAKRKKPRHETGGGDGPRLGLTEEQRDLFQRVIVPGAPGNPFKSMAARNYVMLSMAFNLGLRSGELLGLKIGHLTLTGRRCYVDIIKTPDDIDDKRRLPPGQKTLERTLPLQANLAQSCEAYLLERNSHPAARQHDFFFINQDGGALGERGLQKVYETLRGEHTDLETLINHVLRHDWNDRWAEMAAMSDMDPALLQEVQAAAMGWVLGSAMPQLVYGQRSRSTKTDELLLNMQEQSRSRRGGTP